MSEQLPTSEPEEAPTAAADAAPPPGAAASDAPAPGTAASDAPAPGTAASDAPAPTEAPHAPTEPPHVPPTAAFTPPSTPHVPGPGVYHGGDSGESDGANPTAAIASTIEERPEVGIGAAFAGGFLLAMILRRLAR